MINKDFIGKAYKCTQCEFVSTAKTPRALIAAMKRHRKAQPEHNKLTRVDETK